MGKAFLLSTPSLGSKKRLRNGEQVCFSLRGVEGKCTTDRRPGAADCPLPPPLGWPALQETGGRGSGLVGSQACPPSRNILGLWETVHSLPLIPHLL